MTVPDYCTEFAKNDTTTGIYIIHNKQNGVLWAAPPCHPEYSVTEASDGSNRYCCARCLKDYEVPSAPENKIFTLVEKAGAFTELQLCLWAAGWLGVNMHDVKVVIE